MGVRSFGRQTIWATVNWATDQLGDNHLGDTFRSTGRHNFDYLGDSVGSVNWYTYSVGQIFMSILCTVLIHKSVAQLVVAQMVCRPNDCKPCDVCSKAICDALVNVATVACTIHRDSVILHRVTRFLNAGYAPRCTIYASLIHTYSLYANSITILPIFSHVLYR